MAERCCRAATDDSPDGGELDSALQAAMESALDPALTKFNKSDAEQWKNHQSKIEYEIK
jgi:hypothetical protein